MKDTRMDYEDFVRDTYRLDTHASYSVDNMHYISEAVYHFQRTGVDQDVETFTYDQMREFQPLNRMSEDRTAFGDKLRLAGWALKRPLTNLTACYAMQQSARLVWTQHHGQEAFERGSSKYPFPLLECNEL